MAADSRYPDWTRTLFAEFGPLPVLMTAGPALHPSSSFATSAARIGAPISRNRRCASRSLRWRVASPQISPRTCAPCRTLATERSGCESTRFMRAPSAAPERRLGAPLATLVVVAVLLVSRAMAAAEAARAESGAAVIDLAPPFGFEAAGKVRPVWTLHAAAPVD